MSPPSRGHENTASDAAETKRPTKDRKRKEMKKIKTKTVKKHFLKFIWCGRSETITEEIEVESERRPVTAEQIELFIASRSFHSAVKDLIEWRREEYTSTNNNSPEELQNQGEKVKLLYTLLWEELSEIFHRSIAKLSNRGADISKDISELKEAVKALEEQVTEDQKLVLDTEGPQTEPSGWRTKWEQVVAESVKERMCLLPPTLSDHDSSSVAEELEHMGKTMKSDLIVVVERMRNLYSKNFAVCNVYAKYYFRHFSTHLNTITDFGLDEKDSSHLLVWVHTIYPNEIMGHPDLIHNVSWQSLGPLLPPEKISELESQYVSNVVELVKARMNKSLEYEVKSWTGDKPPAVLNSISHSELPIDVIQALNAELEGAERLSLPLANQLLPPLIGQLASFLMSYKTRFEDFLAGNKSHQHYLPTVIANLNSCGDYRDYVQSLEDRHLEAEAKVSVCDIMVEIDEIESVAFDALLEVLILKLQPKFKKLSQKNGLCGHGTMTEIIKISEAHILQLKTLKRNYYQETLGLIHGHLVKEYLKRLMKKKVSAKSAEQQESIAKQITESASLIKECCVAHGSEARWLNDAIPKIAEIVKLQDLDAIKIVVASLAYQYPDISKHHVSAILYLKGNLRHSDVKDIQNILKAIGGTQATDAPKLFSHIPVS
ncbi:tumor necrosis factor alpha-induced protein 2-like isoform X2 [Ambystoma mexicanum]|uniref:tumor necrosis factor alpha-induced protein 2-like isoform X2 n=1 Tax=Ambystoma mexicanum TaxID=8296 RepID=UPI0037E9B32E